MTASGEVMLSEVALERWYRRLLRAYPVDYRRSHGEEILTMLMDSAEPGRRVPARADVIDLLRGAVRQWFRLPVGRSAVATAVLAAVVLGALGAGAGSWLAWQTTVDLPPDTVAMRVTETVAGARLSAPDVARDDGWRESVRQVQVFNPDDQRFPRWTREAAQARLQAEGWTLGEVDEYIVATYPFGKLEPLPGVERTGPDELYQTFTATRDGLTLRTYAGPVSNFPGTGLQTVLYPVSPSAEPVLILLGWLAGATTGWLLTAWASYRLRRRNLVIRAGALLLGLTALWSAADPIPDLYRTLGTLAFTNPGVERIPPPYGAIIGSPDQIGMLLILGLAILALAITGRREPTERPTPAAT